MERDDRTETEIHFNHEYNKIDSNPGWVEKRATEWFRKIKTGPKIKTSAIRGI